MDCSVLEMLIALAGRVAFEDDFEGSSLEWFWRLINNLELGKYSDDVYEISISEGVDEIANRLNERTYSWTGAGGLFPLNFAQEDQRHVELWYQLSAYLLEADYVNKITRL